MASTLRVEAVPGERTGAEARGFRNQGDHREALLDEEGREKEGWEEDEEEDVRRETPCFI